MPVYLDLSKDSLDGVELANRITALFYCKKSLSTGERFHIFSYFQFAPNKWMIFNGKKNVFSIRNRLQNLYSCSDD